MTYSNLEFLEQIHQLTTMSQTQSQALELLMKIDDYSEITIEMWHRTFAGLKLTLSSQEYVIKKLVEEHAQLEDLMNQLLKKHKKE